MHKMANHLRLVSNLSYLLVLIADAWQQAQHSGVSRAPGSLRGRRDVRNTVFVPSPTGNVDVTNASNSGPSTALPPGSVAHLAGVDELGSPIKRAGTPATIPEDHVGSDSTSVHSSRSHGGIVQHPELHEPGLNASIIETVSTWLSGGVVSRSFVIGEVALAHNPPASPDSGVPDPATEVLRLENFQALEKVAANPAFVTSVVSEKGKETMGTDDRAGEYSITLSAIKRSAATVALKYQVHVDDANLSAFSPVLFMPAWQIQDSQASVIVVYTINPAFIHGSSTALRLKNVTVSVGLDTTADVGKATSAMMAPQVGASFKRKHSLVVWKFPELVVDPEHKKLLGRFVTIGPPAKAGTIEARWELPQITGSGLGLSTLSGEASDPFADESTAVGTSRSFKAVPCVQKLVSGRYTAA